MNSNHRNAPPAPTARCRAIAALLPLLDAPDTDAASTVEARAHLDGCAYCQANLADLQSMQKEAAPQAQKRRQRYFESSAGFLRFSARRQAM